MRYFVAGLVVFALVISGAVAPPAAQAQVLMDSFSAGSSWNITLHTNFAFDEVQTHWAGVQMMEAPHMDGYGVSTERFVDPYFADASWATSPASGTFSVGRGDRLTGVIGGRHSLRWTTYFDNDAVDNSVWKLAFYDQGVLVLGGTATFSSVNSFAFSGDDFDPGSIPEPGTVFLLALGLGTFAAGGLRRRLRF